MSCKYCKSSLKFNSISFLFKAPATMPASDSDVCWDKINHNTESFHENQGGRLSTLDAFAMPTIIDSLPSNNSQQGHRRLTWFPSPFRLCGARVLVKSHVNCGSFDFVSYRPIVIARTHTRIHSLCGDSYSVQTSVMRGLYDTKSSSRQKKEKKKWT